MPPAASPEKADAASAHRTSSRSFPGLRGGPSTAGRQPDGPSPPTSGAGGVRNGHRTAQQRRTGRPERVAAHHTPPAHRDGQGRCGNSHRPQRLYLRNHMRAGARSPRSLRFRWRATRQRRRLGHHTRPGCPNSAVETFRRRQTSFGWLRAAPAGRKMPIECGHPRKMVMTGGAVRLTIRFPLPAAGTAGGGGANPHSTQPPPATQPGRQHSAAIPGAQRNTTSRAH